MAATYRASWAGGGSSGTGDRTVTFTPAVGDYLVVFVAVSANTNSAPTMTDSQGGTYSRGNTLTCSWTGASADRFSVFVRDTLVTSAVSHVITAATGSNTAGEIVVVAIQGMLRAGVSGVVQQKGGTGAASSAPSMTFDASCLTGDPTIFGVGSGDTTTTAPTGWTERQDAAQSSPATALEAATRDSGFTGTTITAGATQSTAWGALGVELNPNLPDVTGTSAVTAPVATLSGAGAVSLLATSAVTAPDATLSGSAGVAVAGSFGVTAPDATLTAAALVDIIGTFGVTAPVPTLSATATVTTGGTGGGASFLMRFGGGNRGRRRRR